MKWSSTPVHISLNVICFLLPCQVSAACVVHVWMSLMDNGVVMDELGVVCNTGGVEVW